MDLKSWFTPSRLGFAALGLVIVFCIVMLLNGNAHAQVLSPSSSSTSTSTSSSGANASSGSSSGSRSAASTGNTAAQVTLSQPSSVYSTQPSDVIVRAAPQVYVPNIVTGNVCALGASAGASFIGTGFAVGASWESAQCENRQRAALLYNMGEKQAAKEVLCDTKEVYDGFKRAGAPCLSRPGWDPAGPPMVSQPMAPPVVTPAPTPIVYSAPPAPKVYPRCSRTITDNCIS